MLAKVKMLFLYLLNPFIWLSMEDRKNTQNKLMISADLRLIPLLASLIQSISRLSVNKEIEMLDNLRKVST